MDHAAYFDQTGLRSPYYRVTAKAVVCDNAGRVLVVADNTGTYELPGGGWEHDESFEDCLRREFKEELGVELASVGGLLLTYRGRGYYQGQRRECIMLRIAAQATIADQDFTLDEDEVTQARFVGRDEFIHLNWCEEDQEIVQYVDKLWPPVEKTVSNG